MHEIVVDNFAGGGGAFTAPVRANLPELCERNEASAS